MAKEKQQGPVINNSTPVPEDDPVQTAANAATKPADWPAWLNPVGVHGEEAAIDCGSHGQMIIGLVRYGFVRLSQGATLDGEEELSEIKSLDRAMVQSVQQWPDAWGPIPSTIERIEDRVKAYDQIPGKYVQRFIEAHQHLAKN